MKKKAVLLVLVSILVMPTLYAVQFIMLSATQSTTYVYPDDFPGQTLQQAIYNETVKGEDTIYVKQGTYYEHLNVNKSITLEGFHRDGTILDGMGNGTVVTVTANNAKILEFTIEHGNPYGVYLYNTSNSNASCNIVKDNAWGFQLLKSLDCTLRDNDIKGNTYNFGVSGSTLAHFVHDIDTTNKVDGKPIYYWKDHEHDGDTIPADAGYVAAVNSINITVKDLPLRKNGQGVLLVNTNGSILENLVTSNNMVGIVLVNSSGNLITRNKASNNENSGILLSGSKNNTLLWNTASGNNWFGIVLISCNNSVVSGNNASNNQEIGLYLSYSHYNAIWSNTFSENGHTAIGVDWGFGIYFEWSNHSVSYRNNIIPYSTTISPNTKPVDVYNSFDVQWNSTFEGNYWNYFYNGSDANGDGIGDIPFEIPTVKDNVDYHPLMREWNLTRVFKVVRGKSKLFLSDVITFSNSTLANGKANPNAVADIPGWDGDPLLNGNLVNFTKTTKEIVFVITSSRKESCNVTIPRDWLDGPFELRIDDTPVDLNAENCLQNANYTSIYFTYGPGIYIVKIKGTRLTHIIGDLNGDDKVNILDAIILGRNFGYSV